MKPRIVPIVSPNIHWPLYLENVQVQHWLDFHHKKSGTVDAFISSLEVISGSQGDYLLSFLSFTFLFEITKEDCFDIVTKTSLVCLPATPFSLVSGTIEQWKQAMLQYCTKESSFEIRYCFDCVYIFLNAIYPLKLRKSTLSDETFTLS